MVEYLGQHMNGNPVSVGICRVHPFAEWDAIEWRSVSAVTSLVFPSASSVIGSLTPAPLPAFHGPTDGVRPHLRLLLGEKEVVGVGCRRVRMVLLLDPLSRR
jgi:hypothetical protein